MATLLHHGALYHRSIIPKSLRPFFQGKVLFWRSLRTLDRNLAGVRSAKLEYEARRLFYTLEHSTMHKAEIAALIRQWEDTAREAGEDERIINSPLSTDRIDSAETALSVALEETHEALVSGDYKAVASEVDELLSAHNLPALGHNSESYKRLARDCSRGKLKYFVSS